MDDMATALQGKSNVAYSPDQLTDLFMKSIEVIEYREKNWSSFIKFLIIFIYHLDKLFSMNLIVDWANHLISLRYLFPYIFNKDFLLGYEIGFVDKIYSKLNMV